MRASAAYVLLACAAAQLVGATPPVHVHDPVGSVQGLIGRLLGANYISSFELDVIAADPDTGNDVFELDAAEGKVVLRGNSGASALLRGVGCAMSV